MVSVMTVVVVSTMVVATTKPLAMKRNASTLFGSTVMKNNTNFYDAPYLPLVNGPTSCAKWILSAPVWSDFDFGAMIERNETVSSKCFPYKEREFVGIGQKIKFYKKEFKEFWRVTHHDALTAWTMNQKRMSFTQMWQYVAKLKEVLNEEFLTHVVDVNEIVEKVREDFKESFHNLQLRINKLSRELEILLDKTTKDPNCNCTVKRGEE